MAENGFKMFSRGLKFCCVSNVTVLKALRQVHGIEKVEELKQIAFSSTTM